MCVFYQCRAFLIVLYWMRRLLSIWCDSDNQSHLLKPKSIVLKRTQTHTERDTQDVYRSYRVRISDMKCICMSAQLCYSTHTTYTNTNARTPHSYTANSSLHHKCDRSHWTDKSVYIRWLKWWDAIFINIYFSLLNYSNYLFISYIYIHNISRSSSFHFLLFLFVIIRTLFHLLLFLMVFTL